MALAQAHRPGGIIGAVARLGATAVPTATDVLVVVEYKTPKRPGALRLSEA
jgi:tRNA(Ile2) C34 agmatinyltransferase TiaS